MSQNCRHWRVYQLDDPITGETRYVGITSCSLETRLAYHLAARDNREKWAWITGLAAQGLTPEIHQVDSIYGTRREAEKCERGYIWSYLARGADLLNQQYIVGERESFAAFLRTMDESINVVSDHLQSEERSRGRSSL